MPVTMDKENIVVEVVLTMHSATASPESMRTMSACAYLSSKMALRIISGVQVTASGSFS